MVATYSKNKRIMIGDAIANKTKDNQGGTREQIQFELKKNISAVTAKSINSIVSPNMVLGQNLADESIRVTTIKPQGNNFLIYKSVPVSIKPDNPIAPKIVRSLPATITPLKPKNSSLSKNDPFDSTQIKPKATTVADPLTKRGIGKVFYASAMLQVDGAKKLK